MRISYREVFADLPKNLLKKKMEELSKRTDIKNVVGYDATVKAIPELEALFEAGKIESYPVLVAGGDYFEWRTDAGSSFTEHRPNNLPSTEWRTDPDISYKVHGESHRTDGPAQIGSGYIIWFLNGTRIAKALKNGIYENGNEAKISQSEYAKLLKDKFPSVGNRIEFSDWDRNV